MRQSRRRASPYAPGHRDQGRSPAPAGQPSGRRLPAAPDALAKGGRPSAAARSGSHGNIVLVSEIGVNRICVYCFRVTATDPELRREIVDNVRRFVAGEVIPHAAELERADEYPADIVAQMRELGLFGVTIPEAYGGLGLDLLTYIGVIEELSYGWMSLSGIVNTHTMAALLLLQHGSEEQRQRWLPSMAAGERRGALSLSEPDAGSDTQNISCKAQRDGDFYVINGTKAWVTNGERASLVALAARSDEGISAFIIEKDPGRSFEGITVSKKVGKLGYKGVETVEMSYADHRVPAANLIGEPGRGLPLILGVLEVGRINIAARAVGVARAAFDAALDYAQVRTTFGKPIAQHQAIQLKLGDMATKLEAAR